MLAIAATAGAVIRLASWFRAPGQLRADGGSCAAEVRQLMPPPLTVAHVQDAFTASALRIGRSPAGARDVGRPGR